MTSGPGFLIHYDAIFVRTGDKVVPDIVAEAFEKVEKKVITAYTKKHVKIRDYTLFLCYDFKGLREGSRRHTNDTFGSYPGL